MTLRPPNSATPYASRPRCAPGQRSGSGSRRDCRTRSRRDRRCLGGRTGCRRDPAPVGPHRHPHTHRRRARAPYDRPRCRRRSSPAPEPLTGYPLRTRTELDAFGLDARYGCEAIQVGLTAPHRPAVRRRHEDEPHHVRWRPSGRLITPTYRCSTWSSTGSAGRPSRCGPLPPRLASGCRSWARTRHSTRLLPRRQHSRQSSPSMWPRRRDAGQRLLRRPVSRAGVVAAVDWLRGHLAAGECVLVKASCGTLRRSPRRARVVGCAVQRPRRLI